MPQKNETFTVFLEVQETRHLEVLSTSHSASRMRVRRAAMLLRYVNGVPISDIAQTFRCSALNVEQSIDKALQQEVLSAREKEREKNASRAITLEMVAWVYHVSCQNPGTLGYTFTEWPSSVLAQHVRNSCRAAGYHALAGLRSVELTALLAKHKRGAQTVDQHWNLNSEKVPDAPVQVVAE